MSELQLCWSSELTELPRLRHVIAGENRWTWGNEMGSDTGRIHSDETVTVFGAERIVHWRNNIFKCL